MTGQTFTQKAERFLGALTEAQASNIQQPEDAVMAFADALDRQEKCGCLFRCHEDGRTWCPNCAERHTGPAVLDGIR